MEQQEQSQTTSQQQPKNNMFLGAGLALLLVAAAFFSGLHLGSHQSTQANVEANLFSIFSGNKAHSQEADRPELNEFWKVWDLLQQKYVTSTTSQTITDQQRLNGAIEGLVASYKDPYTVYMPPSDASMFAEDISGNFGGVGMEVGMRNNVVTVIAPLPDSPAQKAGIVAQDVITKINGTSTEDMGVDQAVSLIRGKKGTTVDLTIYRKGESDFLDIPITRDTITIPTIETKQQGDVFDIEIHSFNALAESQMQDALRKYVQSGKQKLILDLRGNPGGFLQSAVEIGSYFIPAGEPIVRENFGGDKAEQVYRSKGKTLQGFAPKEIVVLVDGGSASAAEILSGALQDHRAATVMGQQTFGKGSVQELMDMPSGASLKVTIARWYTPNGTSISEKGLTPDVIVNRTPQQIVAGEDPQFTAAVKYLDGDHSVGTSTVKTTDQ